MIDITEDTPGILISNSPEAKEHHYVEATHEASLRMSSNGTQSEAAAIRMSLLRSGEARLTRISLAIGSVDLLLHFTKVKCNQTCFCQRSRLSCFGQLPDVVF